MSSSVYTRNNTDDIFNRSVIGGLLNLLNHKISYEQIWDNNVIDVVEVPFVYNFVSSEPNERFIQDNYTFFGRECFTDKIIDGNFEMLPRFTVNYDGSQIDSSNITNRFVKGEYQVNENGKINSYVGYMFTVPLTMNFSVEGWVDNYVSAFKIEQQIRDVFYKNKTFYVLYKGLKIGCCVGFPETITTGEKTVTYTPSQDNQIKMSFNLAVETYQPCFDQSIKISSDKRIEHFYTGDTLPLIKPISIKLKNIDLSKMYVAGDNMTIKWTIESSSLDNSPVMLYYITPDNEKHIISMPIGTLGEYEWVIPSTISDFRQPEISMIPINDIAMVDTPVIRVCPDDNGNVTTESFKIIKSGKFTGNGYVQVSCDYMDDLGNVYVHDCYVAKVSVEKGVEFIYYYKDVAEMSSIPVMNKKKLKYKKTDYKTPITLGVAYPLDVEICDEIHNILIF